MQWLVEAKDSGTKLLAFLKEKLGEGYSAKSLKRAIEEQPMRGEWESGAFCFYFARNRRSGDPKYRRN